MEGHYSIQACCSNCDWQGQLRLKTGVSAHGQHECPNCGVKAVSKVVRDEGKINPWPWKRPKVVPMTPSGPWFGDNTNPPRASMLSCCNN